MPSQQVGFLRSICLVEASQSPVLGPSSSHQQPLPELPGQSLFNTPSLSLCELVALPGCPPPFGRPLKFPSVQAHLAPQVPGARLAFCRSSFVASV